MSKKSPATIKNPIHIKKIEGSQITAKLDNEGEYHLNYDHNSKTAQLIQCNMGRCYPTEKYTIVLYKD